MISDVAYIFIYLLAIFMSYLNQYLLKSVGSGGSEDKNEPVLSSPTVSGCSTVNPTSHKGTCGFTSHGPLGMTQNATRLISKRLS
jgi:hypothetical protein